MRAGRRLETARAILWTSAVEQPSDEVWRRRALVPMAGLRSFGWRAVSRAELESASPAALRGAVIDAADPAAEALIDRVKVVDASILLDIGRLWRSAPDPRRPDWAAARSHALNADIVVAPHEAAAQALRRVVGPVRVVVLADAQEGDGPYPDRSWTIDAAIAWDDVLNDAAPPLTPKAQPIRLMLFIDLIQDPDLVEPIIREAQRRQDVIVLLVMTQWLAERAPASVALFRRMGVEPMMVDREQVVAGQTPDLQGIDAFLTPVSTNLSAHKRAGAIVERAAKLGIPTFSLQHGLENVGLTYFDEVHGEEVQVNTDHLFVWFPPDFAPPAPAWLKRKFVFVGTVRSPPPPELAAPVPDWSGPVVGVFENLHWHRYSDRFRERFVGDLIETAQGLPDRLFLLKPHHGGQWASKSGIRGAPSNLMLADPRDPAWAPFTAPAIIARTDAVITTPSTVALDGAMAARPVAVAGYDLDLPLYSPLPILRSTAHWTDFLTSGPASGPSRDTFLRRTLVRQDSARHLLNSLVDLVGTDR